MSEVATRPELQVTSPAAGVIRVVGPGLFGDPDAEVCRKLVGALLLVPAVEGVALGPFASPALEIRFDESACSRRDLLGRLSDALRRPPSTALVVPPRLTARDRKGFMRFRRYGAQATGWRIERERLGSLRLSNPILYRKQALCHAVERELMTALGVHRYATNPRTCRVDIAYDPRQLEPAQLIELLDIALINAEHPDALDRPDREFALCTLSLPVAAAAQFAMPALLPVAAAVFLCTALPTLKGAWDVLTRERRLGVDVLDAIVIAACLSTLQIVPGAVLAWCLSFGRYLVRRTENSSKTLLLGAFGKQPRMAWRLQDGQELHVSVDQLAVGDVLVVRTGEVMPADGVVTHGLAMLDQQALTGESSPVERGVGDRVFASTLMIAGEVQVAVERSGGDTATAKIAQILNDTAGYKLASQHKGEALADKAVVPTLAIGAVALAGIGPQGAAAVLNSDMGTGVRMAAPLAMLSTLALCGQRGILVKDRRALDLLCEVDTVLFDKTGTLTRERPEVGRILGVNGYGARDILRFAAAAEQRFNHPIAQAILHRAAEEGVELPDASDTRYEVGYGVSVHVDGVRVTVGSRRFIQADGAGLDPGLEDLLAEAGRAGHTVVLVAADGAVVGALELRACVRPEVPGIIAGLRRRGIKHIAIISGDHEAPTRRLAEELGADGYFAEVLPADKAAHVEALQRQGRRVCFVGDGVNDAIALKTADLSISLRGATAIATDTAQIVFMEQGLDKLCELFDIAHDLQSNVRTSWRLILVPNVLCVIGAFTLGFGIGASVLTNNVAALAALANGVRPMRKVAALEAERRYLLEMQLRSGEGARSASGSAPTAGETARTSDRDITDLTALPI